jgi:hypothetical protein
MYTVNGNKALIKKKRGDGNVSVCCASKNFGGTDCGIVEGFNMVILG